MVFTDKYAVKFGINLIIFFIKLKRLIRLLLLYLISILFSNYITLKIRYNPELMDL